MQLIPQTFPESIQKQLCGFLGLLALEEIRKDDPRDISKRFARWTMLSSMYGMYLTTRSEGNEPLSYVKLMHMAARRQVSVHSRTLRDSVAKTDWQMFWHIVGDYEKQIAEPTEVVLGVIQRLNESGKITSRVVPSKNEGKRSKSAWKIRQMCNNAPCHPALLCFPNYHALGLQQMIYLGFAYRWPHAHMAFSTSLANKNGNPPHFQVMVVPNQGAERIRRIIPSVMNVDWSIRKFNADCYSLEKKEWLVRTEKLMKSIQRTRTLRSLKKKYYNPPISNVTKLSQKEVLTMDLVARSFHLMYLDEEPDLFRHMFNIEKKEVIRTTRSLVKRGVLFPYYWISPRLPTLASVLHGDRNRVLSLVDSFLSNTPTSSVYVCNGGTDAILLSRVPPSEFVNLAVILQETGQEAGLNIRCFKPEGLQSYSKTLYSRLLREDGSWDDDVSGFLSQARSKRVEISKTKAQ